MRLNTSQIALAIGVLLSTGALAILALSTRYEAVVSHSTAPAFHLLDRWKGEVVFVHSEESYRVERRQLPPAK